MNDAALKSGTQEIVVDEVFPHAPETIWKTLTTGELMAAGSVCRRQGSSPARAQSSLTRRRRAAPGMASFTARCWKLFFGVDEWHGHNAFIRDGERIFRTYFINGRGDEAMGTVWNYLDMTALGRQEEWEDSPEGTPQSQPYKWWNWNDSYVPDAAPDPKWVGVSDAGEAAFRKRDG
jgi:hypothetical protein